MVDKENYDLRPELAPSPLHSLSDDRLLEMAGCPGFWTSFDHDSPELCPRYTETTNPATEAREFVRTGQICDREQREYRVTFARDLDNAGLTVTEPHSDYTILRLKLRDRRYDGTPGASPPRYLREIGGVTEENIPDRSRLIGGTDWYYSHSVLDRPARRSVEFSITSSDPSACLENALGNKADRLLVDPKTLFQFVDDPFAALPFDNPTGDSLNRWYLLWWQVVNRGLRGKTIPYPGQASQKGFRGFFRHVLNETRAALKPLGYEELCGVPTWQYVWGLNLHHGFLPENEASHRAAARFFNLQEQVVLPDFAQTALSTQQLGDLDQRHPLLSWFAVLPFALELKPGYRPDLPIKPDFSRRFVDTFEQADRVYRVGDQVWTYPLRPGQNLWYSISTNGNHGS